MIYDKLEIIPLSLIENQNNKIDGEIKQISNDNLTSLTEDKINELKNQYPSIYALLKFLQDTYKPNVDEQLAEINKALGDIEAALSEIVDGNI